MNDKLNIAIIGLGTVGMGVIKLLHDHKILYAKRSGVDLNIAGISARSKDKDRGMDLSSILWENDPINLATNPDIDIIIELIGGAEGTALELVKTALQNGKHVVTANKALIAHHGIELAKIAENNNASLMFEAAVAGGIPIVKALREGFAANKFTRISGIMNGTCNFILTKMKNEGRGFEDVLKEAQDLGYAEADPTFDVDGIDTAHKLSILTGIAYGAKIDLDNMYIQGIRDINRRDIAFAEKFGYQIKLLGVSNVTNDGKIEQRVHPCLVPNEAAIASVNDVINAVNVEGDAVGSSLLTGPGAGALPTASSVIADIIDIASNRAPIAFGGKVETLIEADFADMNNHISAYFLRLEVKDESGVLANVTSILSNENIGVEHVTQEITKKGKSAELGLITHHTSEANIFTAIKILEQQDFIINKIHMIRVEEL